MPGSIFAGYKYCIIIYIISVLLLQVGVDKKKWIKYMNELMDGQVDGRSVSWFVRWMDGCTDGRIKKIMKN